MLLLCSWQQSPNMCSHVSFRASVRNPRKTRRRPISSPLRVTQICKTSVTTTTRSKRCQTSEVVVLMISKWHLNINHHMSFHLAGLLCCPAGKVEHTKKKTATSFLFKQPNKVDMSYQLLLVFCSSVIITLICQRVSRGLC